MHLDNSLYVDHVRLYNYAKDQRKKNILKTNLACKPSLKKIINKYTKRIV